MKTKLGTLILSLAAVTLVCTPLLVSAGGHHGHGGKAMGGPHGFCQGLLGHLGDRLELSDEQRQQIEAIIEEEQPAIEEIRQALADARDSYREGKEPGSFDESTARAFAESQSQQHVELFVAMERMKSKVFAVLTAEQQEQLEEMHSRMQDRPRGMGGPFGQ